jgi:hypothetical protein
MTSESLPPVAQAARALVAFRGDLPDMAPVFADADGQYASMSSCATRHPHCRCTGLLSGCDVNGSSVWVR